MDIQELQQHLDRFMQEENNRGKTEFEGYSSLEMHHILHFTFNPGSPIILQKLTDKEYMEIPVFNQVNYLIRKIAQTGGIKLTAKGFLPTRIVADLYSQGFIKDYWIEKDISKLYKETDSMSVNLTRILVELSGLTKKRNGKISLTRQGEKIASSNEELFRTIIQTFANRFNWAYFDGYGDNKIGQLAFGFSLILLAKYGSERRKDSFYAEKYFKAFPMLTETVEANYDTKENKAARCYSLRTFERFLNYFGVILIEEEGKGLDSIRYITKTSLFDRLFKILPHRD
jgi:hypothetical protein